MRNMRYSHSVKLKSGRFTMLNGRVICFVIFFVLFIAAAFGQDQSDPNIITVVKKIDVAKLNENVEDLNKNVATLTETINELRENFTKAINELRENVKTLNEAVARLDERTKWIGNIQNIMLTGQSVMLAAIIGGPLVVYRRFREDLKQITEAQISAQKETSAQITKLISAQAETSAQITKLISAQNVPGNPKVPNAY